MQLALDQVLPGSVDAVLDALLDPSFVRSLGALPKLGAPEVLSQARGGAIVTQRVRYAFTGALPAAVTRVIDPNKVTWVEESIYDLDTKRATFRIVPDHYGSKLRCAGTTTFTERADAGTRRRIEAELSVKVPLVGRVVERAIASGLEEHLGAEAELLTAWLSDVNG